MGEKEFVTREEFLEVIASLKSEMSDFGKEIRQHSVSISDSHVRIEHLEGTVDEVKSDIKEFRQEFKSSMMTLRKSIVDDFSAIRNRMSANQNTIIVTLVGVIIQITLSIIL